MRIVAGRLGGRILAAPKDRAIRPTSDRLRETLFNVLFHAHGDPVSGARVLDLFAGTGALGLEAISRGAAFALFVDTLRLASDHSVVPKAKSRASQIGRAGIETRAQSGIAARR